MMSVACITAEIEVIDETPDATGAQLPPDYDDVNEPATAPTVNWSEPSPSLWRDIYDECFELNPSWETRYSEDNFDQSMDELRPLITGTWITLAAVNNAETVCADLQYSLQSMVIR